MKTKKIIFLGIVFALISYLLIMFGAPASKAKPLFHPQSRHMLRMDGQNDCWESTDLGLTEAQEKALEGLQRVYALEALPLRIELMSLRFELRYLVRDPNVQSELLFDRQKKISQAQAKLDDLSLSYLRLKPVPYYKRAIDQFSRFSMGTGFGTT
jgi:hypothetical protein